MVRLTIEENRDFAEEGGSEGETLYLFGNPANASHLAHSLAQAERGEYVDVRFEGDLDAEDYES